MRIQKPGQFFYRRGRIRQNYLIIFREYGKSFKYTEITPILQWFYLYEVVSEYAETILACLENKLEEYKRIMRIRGST